ncbi:MAG: hypothetical protein Q9159_003812 [Coniocarpon cinnabarinum]
MHNSSGALNAFQRTDSVPSSSLPSQAPSHPYQPSSPATTPSTSQKPLPERTVAALNPLNYMPSDLSQTRESASQTATLPTDRQISTIPRGMDPNSSAADTSGNWVYPSPQQMYNAMVRKGHTDTPADAVEAMVAVHNFLNEGAWAEVVEWERRFSRGLLHGWRQSRCGEDGSVTGAMIAPEETLLKVTDQPKLLRFMGRSDAMTPKAQLMQAAGQVLPAQFGGPAPFDRHDWFIERRSPSGTAREVRYVIDYYSAGVEATGEPVFYLDIRPAIDGPTAAAERLIRWTRDVWWRASGGTARFQQAQHQNL